MERENQVLQVSFEFALEVIVYCEHLEGIKKYVISRQLLKSGTSIGANVREAQCAESKVDFIHKLKIAAKEADETEYWLFLCKKSPTYPDPGELLTKIISIKKLLSKIISSSKNSLKNSPQNNPTQTTH